MYPDQNQPVVSPPPNNYDFIVNPTKPKRQFGGNFFDGSPKSLIIMVGGALVVIIILFIAFSALQPKGITPQLTALATTQAELANTASQASQNSSNQSVQNFAASVQAVITSQENQLTTMLAASNVKISSATLAQAKDASATQQLKLAAQASNFDPVFKQVMTASLQNYQATLKSLYNQASGKNLKNMLASDYGATYQLLQQGQTLAVTD